MFSYSDIWAVMSTLKSLYYTVYQVYNILQQDSTFSPENVFAFSLSGINEQTAAACMLNTLRICLSCIQLHRTKPCSSNITDLMRLIHWLLYSNTEATLNSVSVPTWFQASATHSSNFIGFELNKATFELVNSCCNQ